MGKRSDFVRVARDFYPTPPEPVFDLSPFLEDVDGFCEPCVGNGALANALVGLGHRLAAAFDIEPLEDAATYATVLDCLKITPRDCKGFSHFITNPPWPSKHGRGEPTLGIIRHLAAMRPTWLLLSADFMHNAYAPEVLAYCPKIVSVGRVRWITDSANDGKDNAAWYCFDKRHTGGTAFHGRGERKPTYTADIEELLGLKADEFGGLL